jgi:flavin reductase (DIM6/NTAB) family NADH-FMN oxidoreductase RutF
MDVKPASSRVFRETLSHFASGVTVVAAQTANGLVGFTATGFTSVSLTPPLILVCVGKHCSAHDGIVGAELFGVSVLSERQEWIAEQFARSGTDRFRNVVLRSREVPRIDGALAQLECRRYELHAAGDHTIVIGEVLAGVVSAGRPLVHFARRFGSFVAENTPRPTLETSTARQGESA